MAIAHSRSKTTRQVNLVKRLVEDRGIRYPVEGAQCEIIVEGDDLAYVVVKKGNTELFIIQIEETEVGVTGLLGVSIRTEIWYTVQTTVVTSNYPYSPGDYDYQDIYKTQDISMAIGFGFGRVLANQIESRVRAENG